MARDFWVISDQHYGHRKFLSFKDKKGKYIRPFSCVEEMDAVMTERYNERVKDNDIVYFLGDLGFGKDEAYFRQVMRALKGKKRLILGNHDVFDAVLYRQYFSKVLACRGGGDFPGGKPFVMTHIPVHEGSLGHSVQWNVHGHIHEKVIDDPRYINACVEQNNYYPFNLDELLARMK